MHAVRSKHQVFDMIFDEDATVDVVKDIKFSLVKTKLPLGSKCDSRSAYLCRVNVFTYLTTTSCFASRSFIP